MCVYPDSSSLWISALHPAQPSAHFLKMAPCRTDYSTPDDISISPAACFNVALWDKLAAPCCDRRHKSWHLKIIMRRGHWLEPELRADVVTGCFHSVQQCVCPQWQTHQFTVQPQTEGNRLNFVRLGSNTPSSRTSVADQKYMKWQQEGQGGRGFTPHCAATILTSWK